MEKISAVYKIVNMVTGDCYVGSSENVKMRWACHKCFSTWKKCPNNQMYKDFQKYGIDKFRFQILAPVEPKYLKQVEEELIEMLQPNYNSYRAKGRNVKQRELFLKKYHSQLCSYNGETLTLGALRVRFRRAGIEHATEEAKKYLLSQQ